MKLFIPSVVLAMLVAATVLASGCTGEPGGAQPPASLKTMTTRRPTTTTTTAPVMTPAVPTTGSPMATMTVAPSWTPGTIFQGQGTVLILGDVEGLRSPRGAYIDDIRFTVVKAPRVEPVSFEIPSTQIIFTKYGVQFGTNYQILDRRNGDRDNLLEEGESFLVSVPIQPPYEIYPGQKFTMAIKIPQPMVTVTAQAPPVLTTEPMVLATQA